MPSRIAVCCVILFLVCSDVLHAHPGRTNSEGCHAGSQPYHCHDGSSNLAAKVPVAVVVASSTKTITTHYFARLSAGELKSAITINIPAEAVTLR